MNRDLLLARAIEALQAQEEADTSWERLQGEHPQEISRQCRPLYSIAADLRRAVLHHAGRRAAQRLVANAKGPMTMTPDEMIAAWRSLHEAGISVQSGSTCQTSDDGRDEITFCFYDTKASESDGELADAQDIDPLRAFELAYQQYKECWEGDGK